jgi:hypothetical protein
MRRPKNQRSEEMKARMLVLALAAVAASVAAGSSTASVASAAMDPAIGSAFPVAPSLSTNPPMKIAPPKIRSRRGHHARRRPGVRTFASVTAAVQCNNDAIYSAPLRDGRASGGEWMYWWPQYLNSTYAYSVGYVTGGPLFANRAGTTSFYVSYDQGKTWSGSYPTIWAKQSPFAWGNLFSVDDMVRFIPDSGTATAWQDLGLRTPQSYTGPAARTILSGIGACGGY